MDYLQIYSDIIENARLEKRKKKQGIYYEKHHILPKCLDGGNEKENLVLLTGKEHFICHKLLTKIYPNHKGILYGFFAMVFKSKKGKRYEVSAREYERVRKLFSEGQTGKGNHMFGKIGEMHHNYGKSPSEETREKLRQANEGKILSEKTKEKIRVGNTGKVVSKETIEKLRIASTGKIFSEESKRKMSKSQTGKILSKKTKEKMSETWKNKSKIVCPWCSKIGNGNIMHRFHFSNCPDNPENNKKEILKQRSEFHKGKKYKIVTCPWCGVDSGINIIHMYHFDNCLENPKNNKEELLKQRKHKIITCPHCNKEGSVSLIKRYHFDNCKLKKNK